MLTEKLVRILQTLSNLPKFVFFNPALVLTFLHHVDVEKGKNTEKSKSLVGVQHQSIGQNIKQSNFYWTP